MKKLFVVLTIGILIFTSCQKDEYFNPETEENWEETGENWEDEDGSNGNDHKHESTEGALTLYKIEGNSIFKTKDYDVADNLISYQTNETLHQNIWSFVSTMIPLKHRDKISQFELFYGAGELLGYVTPINDIDLSQWKFALAIDEANGLGSIDFSNDFAYTVIHEYGHVLTLNDDQINAKIDKSECSNYHTGEGCSNRNSYINKIVEIGWLDIIGQHDQDDPFTTYDNYQDRFLTEYAATNPGEDIAETFTAFIIQENKPTGNSIADQKVKYFYESQELVALRKDIRASINPTMLKSLNMDEYKVFLPKLMKSHKYKLTQKEKF